MMPRNITPRRQRKWEARWAGKDTPGPRPKFRHGLRMRRFYRKIAARHGVVFDNTPFGRKLLREAAAEYWAIFDREMDRFYLEGDPDVVQPVGILSAIGRWKTNP